MKWESRIAVMVPSMTIILRRDVEISSPLPTLAIIRLLAVEHPEEL